MVQLVYYGTANSGRRKRNAESSQESEQKSDQTWGENVEEKETISEEDRDECLQDGREVEGKTIKASYQPGQ